MPGKPPDRAGVALDTPEPLKPHPGPVAFAVRGWPVGRSHVGGGGVHAAGGLWDSGGFPPYASIRWGGVRVCGADASTGMGETRPTGPGQQTGGGFFLPPWFLSIGAGSAIGYGMVVPRSRLKSRRGLDRTARNP